MMPLALAVLAFPPQLRPNACRILSGFARLSVALDPAPRRRRRRRISWPWVFWLNVPLLPGDVTLVPQITERSKGKNAAIMGQVPIGGSGRRKGAA